MNCLITWRRHSGWGFNVNRVFALTLTENHYCTPAGAGLSTIIAVSIVTFAIANLLHEGVGHGGVCLLTGGQCKGTLQRALRMQSGLYVHRGGGDWQRRNKRFDPWADHDRSVVVDKYDIDAAVWQHTVPVFALGTGDRLRPETQEMVRQRLRRRVLAILRSSSCHIRAVIHRTFDRIHSLHHSYKRLPASNCDSRAVAYFS